MVKIAAFLLRYKLLSRPLSKIESWHNNRIRYDHYLETVEWCKASNIYHTLHHIYENRMILLRPL